MNAFDAKSARWTTFTAIAERLRAQGDLTERTLTAFVPWAVNNSAIDTPKPKPDRDEVESIWQAWCQHNRRQSERRDPEVPAILADMVAQDHGYASADLMDPWLYYAALAYRAGSASIARTSPTDDDLRKHANILGATLRARFPQYQRAARAKPTPDEWKRLNRHAEDILRAQPGATVPAQELADRLGVDVSTALTCCWWVVEHQPFRRQAVYFAHAKGTDGKLRRLSSDRQYAPESLSKARAYWFSFAPRPEKSQDHRLRRLLRSTYDALTETPRSTRAVRAGIDARPQLVALALDALDHAKLATKTDGARGASLWSRAGEATAEAKAEALDHLSRLVPKCRTTGSQMQLRSTATGSQMQLTGSQMQKTADRLVPKCTFEPEIAPLSLINNLREDNLQDRNVLLENKGGRAPAARPSLQENETTLFVAPAAPEQKGGIEIASNELPEPCDTYFMDEEEDEVPYRFDPDNPPPPKRRRDVVAEVEPDEEEDLGELHERDEFGRVVRKPDYLVKLHREQERAEKAGTAKRSNSVVDDAWERC